MLVLNMLFIYIMEDLSIILSLLLVVILVSYCTYMFYRPVNIDNFENDKNTENTDTTSRKKLTDEQIEAIDVMHNMIKNSNINISNPCKLINDFCFQRLTNENCNDDRYFNNTECSASLKFCEDPSITKQCGPEEEIIKWMNSLDDEDKKKFFDAMVVLKPEIKALMQ
jgi:hypothetical protein